LTDCKSRGGGVSETPALFVRDTRAGPTANCGEAR
jgi:hypothetical protein